MEQCLDPVFILCGCMCWISIMSNISLALFFIFSIKQKFFYINCILRQLLIDEPLKEHTTLQSSVLAENFYVHEIIDIFGTKSTKSEFQGLKKTKTSIDTLNSLRRSAQKWWVLFVLILMKYIHIFKCVSFHFHFNSNKSYFNGSMN
jgi:hypothetical protein